MLFFRLAACCVPVHPGHGCMLSSEHNYRSEQTKMTHERCCRFTNPSPVMHVFVVCVCGGGGGGARMRACVCVCGGGGGVGVVVSGLVGVMKWVYRYIFVSALGSYVVGCHK